MQISAVVGGYFFALFLIGNFVISITGMIGGDALISKCTGEIGIIRFFYLIMNGIVWYILNWGCMSYISRKKIKLHSIKSVACISILGFIGSAFLGLMLVNSFSIQVSVVWYVFILFFLFFIFSSYFVMKQNEIKTKMTILATKNEMLERNYMQINEFYTANAKLYHDMNHHFDALYHLLQDGYQEQAKKYLEEIRTPSDYTKMEVHTGISVLDAIVYEMRLKAQEKGIVFEMEISMLPCDIGFENKDICSLFANLLENAVEASENKVYVQIKRINQTLLAVVKNDYSVKPVINEKKFVSLKKDKILHGWGIQIVEQIVEKYEGSIEYDLEDEMFTVSVMLNEIIEN
ncbi:MAG: sensor histidine kinase [Lachnospiraceae bacterium]